MKFYVSPLKNVILFRTGNKLLDSKSIIQSQIQNLCSNKQQIQIS